MRNKSKILHSVLRCSKWWVRNYFGFWVSLLWQEIQFQATIISSNIDGFSKENTFGYKNTTPKIKEMRNGPTMSLLSKHPDNHLPNKTFSYCCPYLGCRVFVLNYLPPRSTQIHILCAINEHFCSAYLLYPQSSWHFSIELGIKEITMTGGALIRNETFDCKCPTRHKKTLNMNKTKKQSKNILNTLNPNYFVWRCLMCYLW